MPSLCGSKIRTSCRRRLSSSSWVRKSTNSWRTSFITVAGVSSTVTSRQGPWISTVRPLTRSGTHILIARCPTMCCDRRDSLTHGDTSSWTLTSGFIAARPQLNFSPWTRSRSSPLVTAGLLPSCSVLLAGAGDHVLTLAADAFRQFKHAGARPRGGELPADDVQPAVDLPGAPRPAMSSSRGRREVGEGTGAAEGLELRPQCSWCPIVEALQERLAAEVESEPFDAQRL